MPRPSRDAIAAIATPQGRGGVGIVRVSAPELADFTITLLGRRLPPRRAALANFRDASGQVIDQGLALYFPAPNSFTGEDVLELQGHGSPVVMRMLLARCLEIGARQARPGEFSERAFLNGRIDLAQAEAVADLIDAATASAAKSALRSLQGEFSRAIVKLAGDLVALRVLAEATLDFPEEEVDLLREAKALARLQGVRDALAAVQARAQRGNLLRAGLQVVLVGRPNVGKSSLLNRLAGDDVAIVTPVAGTTRDALKSTIQIHGIPLHIIDTAGLRDTADEIERIGIERAWKEIGVADLALLMVDATVGITPEDCRILDRLPARLTRLTVFNKVDLLPNGLATNGLSTSDAKGDAAVAISATRGDGMDRLESELLRIAGWQDDEDVFMARGRHLEALSAADEHLREAAGQLERLDIFAEELRLAHRSLQEITGEYTSDDLLGTIFSTFCIGK